MAHTHEAGLPDLVEIEAGAESESEERESSPATAFEEEVAHVAVQVADQHTNGQEAGLPRPRSAKGRRG